MTITTTSSNPRISSQRISAPGIWIAVMSDPAQPMDETGKPALRLLAGDAEVIEGANGEALVFSGRLANRDEVSGSLSGGGAECRSDATLVLNAYEHWGESAFEKITGRYSFCLADPKARVGFAVGDRIGRRPLFFAEVSSDLVVSTSIHALLSHPGISGNLNRLVLAETLLHRWPVLDETFFAEISRVPPGHVLRKDAISRTVTRYWDPTGLASGCNWVDESVVDERFDELFEQAVTRSLERGRPAVFLSGGLDSVSVAAMAAERTQDLGTLPPVALSLVFPDPDCNEEPIQREVATKLGLEHVVLHLDDAVGPSGLVESCLALNRDLSAPVQNFWWPAYRVLAQQGLELGCSEILTGSGGDEWLGVSPLLAADLWRGGDLLALYRLWTANRSSYRSSAFAMFRTLAWRFGLRPNLEQAVLRVSPEYARRLLVSVRTARRRAVARDLLGGVPQDPALRKPLAERARLVAEQSTQRVGPGGFYLKEVQAPFYHALTALEMEEIFEEGRNLGIPVLQPYWDSELVDFLARVPPALLNRGDRSKGLVRGSLSRRFPQLGFERQKKVTSANYFRGTVLREGRRAWDNMRPPYRLAELGIVDGQALETNMRTTLDGSDRHAAYRVWDVLNLESWARSNS